VSRTAQVASFWDGVPGGDDAMPVASPYVSARGAEPAPRTPVEPEPRPSFAELEREAFTKGYAQGERAGAEAAAHRGEAALRRLAQTLDELAGLRGELLQKTERQVVELAMAIAGRVLRRELSIDRELLIAMAHVALERLGENTSATIRLNPEDYAAIGAQAHVSEHDVVRVVADPLVSPGGCLVQSDFGLIDAGIDAQLGEMAAALGVSAPAAPSRRAGREAA
jgi:flagellar assembly protein FliH